MNPQRPSKDGPRANRDIAARSVRLVGADGAMIGVVPLREALEAAADVGLDLVEVSPNVEPPVCKILDLGKFKYEAQKKAAEARKRQRTVEIKELKFRPVTDDNDYGVKLRNARRFLEDGNKVKATLRFRGREMAHQELGLAILRRLADDLADLGKVESHPRLEGRQMVMMVAAR